MTCEVENHYYPVILHNKNKDEQEFAFVLKKSTFLAFFSIVQLKGAAVLHLTMDESVEFNFALQRRPEFNI